MVKYIIFATYRFYPNGGMDDIDSKHETEESMSERVEILLEENHYDIIHVLNLDDLNVWRVKGC